MKTRKIDMCDGAGSDVTAKALFEAAQYNGVAGLMALPQTGEFSDAIVYLYSRGNIDNLRRNLGHCLAKYLPALDQPGQNRSMLAGTYWTHLPDIKFTGLKRKESLAQLIAMLPAIDAVNGLDNNTKYFGLGLVSEGLSNRRRRIVVSSYEKPGSYGELVFEDSTYCRQHSYGDYLQSADIPTAGRAYPRFYMSRRAQNLVPQSELIFFLKC